MKSCNEQNNGNTAGPNGVEYIGYIDFKVLILLFCLMAAVAGLRSLGVFDALSAKLLSGTGSARMIAFILMNLCFFSSMLVTNDVALITFVPLTLGLYSCTGLSQQLIATVVIETAAANLGSMLTPIGNPQNLFLFSHYEMGMGDFFAAVLPLGLAGYALLCGSVLLVNKGELKPPSDSRNIKAGWRLAVYAAVFLICVLAVAGLVSEYICLALTLVAVIAADPRMLTKVDYPLLLTFVFFFIFSGNMARIPEVKEFFGFLLEKSTLVFSTLSCQVISNVPSAILLSQFTTNYRDLLIGVNIGGVGTLISSLASLITLREYLKENPKGIIKYILKFSAFNFAFLFILLGFNLLWKLIF